MEPEKIHGAALPQEKLTHSPGVCHFGPRPSDLLLEGHEGANPHVGQRVAEINLTRLDLFKLLENSAHLRGPKSRPLDIPESERTTIVLNAIYPNGFPDNIHSDFDILKKKKCNKVYL